MTFTIKHRSMPGAPMIAEYMCPEHGRFELTVERDGNGDPPATMECLAFNSCDSEMESVANWPTDKPCGLASPFVISATNGKVDSMPCTAVTRGGDMKDRPPGMLDTRPLAEGMPMSEWRKVQKKHQEERRHHQLIAKGLKTRRVQV